MATTHIGAEKGDIEKVVLMAGDPLRIQYYADKFLKNKRLVSSTRGMLAYSGEINGLPVTLMGHGMGLSSIGLYSFELFKFHGVEMIIRIGSSGAYTDKLNIYDLVVADHSYSLSNYGITYNYFEKIIPASKSLVESAHEAAKTFKARGKIAFTTANASMWFYDENPEHTPEEFVKMGVGVVEMEGYALYVVAKYLNKKALTILTVSDSMLTSEGLSSMERERTFDDMLLFAVKTAEIELKRG